MRTRGSASLLGIVLVLLLAMPALAFGAPTVIDDTAFTYGGGTWLVYSDPGMSGGSNHYTATNGAWGEVTFTGTKVTFITTTGNNRGLARIYLDGVDQGTVNQYSTAIQYQQRLWTKSGLAPGSHTLRVVHPGSGGPYVEIDAIEVDTETPPVVSTSASAWWSIVALCVGALGVAAVVRRKLVRVEA